MQQGQPIADALPGMSGPATMLAAAYKAYRWKGWETPEYDLRLKDSYKVLNKAILALPGTPPDLEHPEERVAASRNVRVGPAGPGKRMNPQRKTIAHP